MTIWYAEVTLNQCRVALSRIAKSTATGQVEQDFGIRRKVARAFLGEDFAGREFDARLRPIHAAVISLWRVMDTIEKWREPIEPVGPYAKP